METIDDLKEILTAAQELGAKWQEEIISLRAENSELRKANETLRKNYESLHEENKTLRAELNDLSEKTEQLNQNLREEIIAAVAKELDAAKQDEFQNFVKDYLKEIRERVDGNKDKQDDLKNVEGKEPTVKVEEFQSDDDFYFHNR